MPSVAHVVGETDTISHVGKYSPPSLPRALKKKSTADHCSLMCKAADVDPDSSPCSHS